MSAFKQGAFALIIVAGAGFAWLKLDPNAVTRLEQVGVSHPALTALAATGADEATPAGGPSGAPAGAAGGGGMASQARLVITEPTGRAQVNDRLSAIGNGEAVRTVNVTPYVTGNLEEVLVESGQSVEEGDVIAELASDEQVIAVERARLDLEDAETTLQRRQTLRDSSASAIANVEITQAELAVQTARLQLREAELNLSRRSITAPIGGVIGIVSVNPGDYVTTTTEIVRIDDRSELLVDFWVPERFASMIAVGLPVTANAISSPDQTHEGEISAVDNRVDLQSRTLWVRASIPNENDRLRAGMSFSVELTFDGDDFPTVDPLALQWSADGSFVWRVVDGRSQRVPVRIVQRNSDSILVDAELEEGDDVVVEGLMQLRDGAEVVTVTDDAGEAGDAVAVGLDGLPVARNIPAEPSAAPSGS